MLGHLVVLVLAWASLAHATILYIYTNGTGVHAESSLQDQVTVFEDDHADLCSPNVPAVESCAVAPPADGSGCVSLYQGANTQYKGIFGGIYGLFDTHDKDILTAAEFCFSPSHCYNVTTAANCREYGCVQQPEAHIKHVIKGWKCLFDP